ncbi:MAG: YmfQ family protein [Caulobacteraceae bacterium]
MPSKFSAADYQRAFQAHLPRGRVWPADPDSVQARAIGGLTAHLADIDARAIALLADGFPATTNYLLPEWEASLGLPDPCAGPAPTVQQRQGQVLARFTDSGGQSIAHLEAFALKLGFQITITNYAPFRAGRSRAGDPATGQAWAHAFAVHAPAQSPTPFRAGRSAAGEPLNIWGNAVLECELRAHQPAHTVVIFLYAGSAGAPVEDEGGLALLDEGGFPILDG